MATTLETSIPKIDKLDSSNYHTWKRDMEMLLTLKDIWDDMHEARPPSGDERVAWQKLQKHALAIIHLSCTREAAAMIADSTTGIEAWITLNNMYASANIQNIMRMEEKFGRAKKEDSQTMQQWISSVKTLAAQLREAEVDITPIRVAHRILSELPKDYDTIKYSLKARLGPLSIEVVTEHLLEAEQDMKERTIEKEQKENRPINALNQSGSPSTSSTYQIGGQLSRPRATAMPMYTEVQSRPPVYTEVQSCPPGCHCSIHVHASGSIGPNRHERPSYRQHPYGREQRDSLYCHFCCNLGHTQNRCWLKFPHLRPQWRIDMDRARGVVLTQEGQRNTANQSNTSHVVQVPDSQS